MSDERYVPLLPNVSQFEVDFVVPRKGVDLPVGIDPFLLFKSRDPDLSRLHSRLLDAFNAGLEAVRQGKMEDARYLLDFPEVAEIGLGNATKKGKRGSGVGTYLAELIIETLRDSPPLMERGIHHIEEMQLVSLGIGPDRVSDIAANLIRSYLIEYTQKQAGMWSLPLASGVPVPHVFDPSSMTWSDGYYDLPISPVDNSPILLVPRRIVRTLPWINYNDFFRLEFAAYLRAKRVRSSLSRPGHAASHEAEAKKKEVTAAVRADVDKIDHYVKSKETASAEAQPSQSYIAADDNCTEANQLKARLSAIPTGQARAADYQFTVLAILNYLFNPELIDGATEVRTVDGTERRDIIFTNDSDINFWEYLRQEHSSIFVMFEVKNMGQIEAPALNQTATYLGDRLGRLAFIVTRNAPGEPQIRKAYSIYNDPVPRRIILFLTDNDLKYMLDMKCQGNPPTSYLQNIYRKFRTSVQ